MIKKIKNSLTSKIFLITLLLLTIFCIATYLFIIFLIPKTYPHQFNMDEVEVFADKVLLEVQNTRYEDYLEMANALEETAQMQYGEDLTLYIIDSHGEGIYGDSRGRDITGSNDNRTTRKYTFSFLDSSEIYTLFIADGSMAVNQALVALNRVFPLLMISILIISISTAFVYSKYITAPILKISKASKRMAALDFSLEHENKRTDELGTVYQNLSALAEGLSSTLQELEAQNAQLVDDMNREKELEKQRIEFFSAVSHELKTPITIAKGQLQGMIYGVGRYKDRDTYLLQSLEVINRLEIMVQELLIVTRMETPGYSFQKAPFNLAYIMKQCLTAQEDIFIERNMSLTCEIPEQVTYCGDQQLIKKVFDNLIINALSYSPIGSAISISVKQNGNYLAVYIENSGVHISQSDLSRLFEAYYRPDQSRNRQTGGSGLGLYIVKKILDLHEANYCIDNSKNGVIFTIIF